MKPLSSGLIPPACPFFVVWRLMRVGVVPMARFRWRVRGPLGVLKILVRVDLGLLATLALLFLFGRWLRYFLDLERSISERAIATTIGSSNGLIFEFSRGIDRRSGGRPSSFATGVIFCSSQSCPLELFCSGFLNAPSAGASSPTVTSAGIQSPSLSRIQVPGIVEQYVVRAIAVLSL